MSTFVSPLNKGITCNINQLVTKQSVKIAITIIQAYTSMTTTKIIIMINQVYTSMTTTAGVS
jgi:hypothetical protein